MKTVGVTKLQRIVKLNELEILLKKYIQLDNPSKHKRKKWEQLKNEAIWASAKIDGKYDRQKEKVMKKAKKTVSKEKLEELKKAKEEFSKLYRERTASMSMRDIRKEDRAKYEKARQNLIDAMNNVTMDIVKGSNKSSWGAMKVTNYLLNEKDNSAKDRYGLNTAFEWDIEKDKLKKRR